MLPGGLPLIGGWISSHFGRRADPFTGRTAFHSGVDFAGAPGSRVIAVGPGRFEKGARVPMELKVGDQVIYGKYSGTPYTFEGDEYVIIKATDVLAKLG